MVPSHQLHGGAALFYFSSETYMQAFSQTIVCGRNSAWRRPKKGLDLMYDRTTQWLDVARHQCGDAKGDLTANTNQDLLDYAGLILQRAFCRVFFLDLGG